MSTRSIALFTVAALVAAPLAPIALRAQSFPTSSAAATAPEQRALYDVYRQLVEINTVDSVGSVTKAAQAMAARFRAAGFPASDVRVLVPPGRPTKGNLVVRLHGRPGTTRKPVLLLAHLDVVAANRADWPRDPFALHEEKGYFLGRGTSDDKAMASIFVANMLRYKREGFVPDRDIVLALTADEEGGEANGAQWLATEHKSLIDAAYALNEGGGGTLDGDRPIFHTVQAAEKVPVNYTLTVVNSGGHSSVPRPDNAIYALADALAKLGRYRFPVALNDVTTQFFARTAAVEPRADLAAAMRAITANPADSAAAAMLSRDPRYASMLRTTCVATRLAGGHAYNALPQLATANVNCRIVPTSTDAEVKAALERIVADTSVAVSYTIPPTEKFGVVPSAGDSELMSAVASLTTRMWGAAVPVIPTMSTGATDGRFLRAAGIPTFGVSGIFSTPGETNAHGRDEKLRVRSPFEGQAFLYELVKRVSGAPTM